VEHGASRGDDNQRGGSAKKKITEADQTSADDADASSQAPSRVHIFKGKSLPGASSKSGDEPLQCSSFRANTRIHLGHGAVQGAIPIGIQTFILGLRDELKCLTDRVGKGKKALYEAAMKAEDLEAVMEALRRTRNNISKRRK